MTVVSLRVGGLAHDGAQVKAKLDGVTSARLAVDTDDQFGDPVFFEPVSSDSEGVRTFAPSGLEPGATYFYAVEQDDVLAPAGLLLDGSGDYASTPDDASLDITGDIDLRCEATLDDWASGSFQALLAKWLSPNRSYAIFVEPGGEVRLAWSTDGTSGNAATSTVAPDVEDGGRLALRTILDVDDGTGGWTARIYTAPTIDGPWTQLGDPVDNGGGGTTSIFSGTQELEAGSQSSGTANNITGIIHAVEARDGIDGTVVADPDFTAEPSGTASFDDDAGRTWTLNGDAQIGGTGRFVTAPGEPGEAVSYAVAVAGDAGQAPDFPDTTGNVLASDRISNHTVFDTIRTHPSEPIIFIHPGDATYYDLGSDQHGITGGGNLENYRQMFDDLLLQSRQHELYRTIPTVQLPDDHDFGPNNSDGTLPDKANFSQAYREKVPAYPLVDSGSVNQAPDPIGRVQWVFLDTRYYRSPSPDPDGPAKTMLGAAQKQWLADVLSTSTAEALVVVSSVPWIGGGGDAWPGFATERQELADLFVSTGWADRMIMLCADAHKLGFDSGANNEWGGFPVYICASMDASPNNNVVGYDIGEQGGRDQYAIVTVSDSGSDITLTTTGFSGSSAVMSHSLVVNTTLEPEPEPEEPDAGLAQVAQAQIRTRLTWLACNLSDGAVITELPDLQGDEVSRVIGEYTSANLSLPIPAVGGRDLSLSQRAALAIQSTQPPRTKIVAIVNDVPAWEGIPLPRDLGTDATIPLGCVSMEGYLRHVYITDHTFNEQDVALIADGILRDAVTTPHGPGIAMTIDAPNIGATASRSYLDIDDQTVFDGLSELMDAGLIEWTLEPDWRAGFAYRIVDTIARVRGRLGRAGSPQAVFQSATFSSQGASDARYQLKEDYSGDRYANVVRLTGTGEGVDQPRSAPAINQDALDAGVPVWELRDSAPQTVKAQALLDLHAERRLDRVRSGAQTLEITARWDAPGARLGVDWRVGDDVRHELRGTAHPNGLNGVRRAIGFALSIQRGTIRPILQEDL